MDRTAEEARMRFQESMAEIAIGATLAAMPRNDQARAKPRHWIVTHQRRYDSSITLTLRCGRHEIRVHVGICHTGPELMDVGMRSVAPAPSQRNLFREPSHA